MRRGAAAHSLGGNATAATYRRGHEAVHSVGRGREGSDVGDGLAHRRGVTDPLGRAKQAGRAACEEVQLPTRRSGDW